VTDYTDIAVRGALENVQNLVAHAFAANGFQVAWASATKGKAEKGKRGMNIAFGALAQYYAVEFEILPTPDGAVLRLFQSVSGWWGGIWGRMKVKEQWKQLTNTLAEWFQQQGVLMGVREAKV
jgi:hypothetical protein